MIMLWEKEGSLLYDDQINKIIIIYSFSTVFYLGSFFIIHGYKGSL